MLLNLSESLFVLLKNLFLIAILCFQNSVLPLYHAEFLAFALQLKLALFQNVLQVGLALN